MTPIDNADDLINSLMDQIERLQEYKDAYLAALKLGWNPEKRIIDRLQKTVEIDVNSAPSEWDELNCIWFNCPACGGHNVAKGWNFCPKCGAQVKWIKEERK